MKLLDAVNLVLPKLGEHQVTSLTVKHPTLAVILPEVENALKQILLRGWWFNQFDYTGYPDTDGYIQMGTDTLSFVPHYTNAAVRDGKLYNTDTLSYVWTEPVQGALTQYIPFDQLPESAAQFVWQTALVSLFITDIGLGNEVQAWQRGADLALKTMLGEHLRNRKFSSKKTLRFYRLRQALGGY